MTTEERRYHEKVQRLTQQYHRAVLRERRLRGVLSRLMTARADQRAEGGQA